MKHNLNITKIIILLFFFAQIIGLFIINGYIDHTTTASTGNLTYSNLPMNIDRPEVEESYSFIWIMIAILVSTAVAYMILKFKRVGIWKGWFFLAVVLGLTIAFKVFLPFRYGEQIAIVLAILFAFFKVIRPNILVHNFSELFIYGGIAAVFVPIVNLQSAFILLILISVYDAFAVWKSKHMIKLAKFQSDAKLFAGISLPYTFKDGKAKIVQVSNKKQKKSSKKVKSAILGGGDIVFPLIFAGALLKTLVLEELVITAFLKTGFISITTTIALGILLFKADKGKFYPAMPFISVGVFTGYIILKLLGLI